MSISRRMRSWATLLYRPTGPPPRPTRRNWIFDAALAFGLAVVAVRYASSSPDGVPALIVDRMPPPSPVPPVLPEDGEMEVEGGMWGTDAAISAVAAAAALVFRRRYPIAVLWVVLGITVLAASSEPGLIFYACVVAAYSAAAYSQFRAPALATIALAAVAVTRDISTEGEAIPIVPEEFLPLLVLVPIVVAADGMRRWRFRLDESRMRLSKLEREHAEAVRRAAREERSRIARELHDVVTHNVSVMVIQAGAARKVMATAPDQATEALLAVESGGRAAMSELRQVMGLLRQDDESSAADDTEDLTPQPGLDRLESLVARVQDAGLAVELDVVGQVRALPPGVELAAYRVVQEALTNTMKHASGAVATVRVDYRDDELRVEVVDTGGSPVESAGAGNKRGLIGLRERLTVHGGTLTTGRRVTGGYRVEAVIPVEAS